MNKAAIYISLLMALVLGLVLYTSIKEQKEVALRGDGLQFERLTQREIIAEFAPDIVFIIKDKRTEEATLYKVDKYSGSGKYDLLKSPVDFEHGSQPNYFIQAMNGEFEFIDTLDNVEADKIKQMVYDAPQLEALKLIRYEEATDTFSFLEDSVFIFFGLAILWLLIFLIVEIPIVLINKFFNRNLRIGVYAVLSIFAVRFLQIGLAPATFPINNTVTWLRPILLLLPTFIVYQWFVFARSKKLEFADDQLIKFCIIFIGTILCTFVTDALGVRMSGSENKVITTAPNNLTIAFAFSVALGNLLFNVTRYFWKLRNSNKELVKAKKEVTHTQAELNALQSSVNPHFLYNALNSIAALAKEDPARTEKMTIALSQFYRYNTNREESSLTTLLDEVEMLKTYVEIEKIRFEDRLECTFDVSENTVNEKIPHFLLQPLVENAIKYGFNSANEKIKVHLKVYKVNNRLKMAIFDSGAKFSAEMQKGYGLKSVSKKLKFIYPNTHQIEFINEPKKHVLITIE